MRIGPVVFALVSLAACSPNNDVTVPNGDVARFGEGEAGAYVLRSIAGKALPAEVYSNESAKVTVIADTVFLHGGGKGANVTIERVTDETQPQGRVYRNEAALEYTLEGNRLTVEFVCNDVLVLAACAAPPHLRGALDGAALNVDFAMMQRVPQRFEKVAGATTVAKVEISPLERLTVGVGGTLQLSSRVLDAEGRVVPGKAPTWHSVISPVVSVSNTGTVRGLTRGIGVVTAFVEGRADTVTVHVEP